MKDLSKETISVAVGALIAVRMQAINSLHEAERDGHAGYQATLQLELDANAEALRELNHEVAPWLEFHAQLRDVFAERQRTA